MSTLESINNRPSWACTLWGTDGHDATECVECGDEWLNLLNNPWLDDCPTDSSIEEESMAAYRRGESTPLQERINELYLEMLQKYVPQEKQQEMQAAFLKPLAQRLAALKYRIIALQRGLAATKKYQQAIELLEKGPLTSVSALEFGGSKFGGFNITVKSGGALVSATYEGCPLVDAMLSATKARLS